VPPVLSGPIQKIVHMLSDFGNASDGRRRMYNSFSSHAGSSRAGSFSSHAGSLGSSHAGSLGSGRGGSFSRGEIRGASFDSLAGAHRNSNADSLFHMAQNIPSNSEAAEVSAEHKEQFKRQRSISTKMRLISNLSHIIPNVTYSQKDRLKDLLLMGDNRMDDAMEAYHEGDVKPLTDLLASTRISARRRMKSNNSNMSGLNMDMLNSLSAEDEQVSGSLDNFFRSREISLDRSNFLNPMGTGTLPHQNDLESSRSYSLGSVSSFDATPMLGLNTSTDVNPLAAAQDVVNNEGWTSFLYDDPGSVPFVNAEPLQELKRADMTPEEAAMGMKPPYSPDSPHKSKSKEEREKEEESKHAKAISINLASKQPRKYTPEERRIRILRFLDKRKKRNWTKKAQYRSRQEFAKSRVRVKGRFVSKTKASELQVSQPGIPPYPTMSNMSTQQVQMLAQLLQQQQQQFTSFQQTKLPDPATPSTLPSASAPIPIPNAATGIPPPEQTGDPGGSSGGGCLDPNLGRMTRARMRSWNQNRGDRDPLMGTMRFGQQPAQPATTGPLKADMGSMHQPIHAPATPSWATTSRDHSRPENMGEIGIENYFE